MPSKSPAQHRLMEAAAHSSGGYGGVPRSVGREFVAADVMKKSLTEKHSGAKESSPMPKGYGR